MAAELPAAWQDLRMWASRRFTRSFAPPDWLTVNLTLRCNLRCVMCTTCYDSPELNTREILDLIDQAAAWGVRIFNPLGGEPFIRADLEQILQHAARRDLHTTLTTNATLINEARAALIARVPVEKLHLNISLDGPEPVHDAIRGEGTFRRAMTGYARLREAPEHRKIACNSILHRKNLDRYLDFVDELADAGFDGVQVLNLFRSREDDLVGGMWFLPEDLPRLERVVERLAAHPLVLNRPEDLALVPRYYREGLSPLDAPCWAGWKELYVNADGTVIMCDGHLDFLAGRFGDVRTHTLRQLWESPALRERRAVVKGCTTPCIQNCYLRRESDSLRAIARRVLPPLPTRTEDVDQTLVLELCDIPDDPADPRLRAFFARSPVPYAAVLADPGRLPELRDRGYLSFGRGFLGVEVAVQLLDRIAAGGQRFRRVELAWRGEPLLHPELDRLLPALARRARLSLSTSGRLLTPELRSLLARHDVEVRGLPVVADGPVLSWEGRVAGDLADTGLRRIRGDALKQPWRAIRRAQPPSTSSIV